MKITVVCAHFPPHFSGGAEVVALAQARALALRGHEVSVVAGTDRPHAAGDLERVLVEGLPVTFLPRTNEEREDLLQQLPRLTELLVREVRGSHVIHLHHGPTLPADAVRGVSRVAPVVLALNDFLPVCPRFFRTPPDPSLHCPPAGSFESCVPCLAPELGKSPAREIARGLIARSEEYRAEVAAAARVIVPSRTHLVRLAEFLDFAPGQARILQPGLCLAFPTRRRRPQAWTGEGPLRVLHFGRRSQQKGTLDLVQAMAGLPAGSVELVALGGSEEGFDARLREQAGDLALSLAGPYGPGELARAAADCHLAAFPSRLPESYALVVDEAIALGLPVWIAGGAAARERFEPPVLETLPSASPEIWRKAFETLLDDPGRAREACRALPSQLPTADDAAAILERWYRELPREPALHDPLLGHPLPHPQEHRRPA